MNRYLSILLIIQLICQRISSTLRNYQSTSLFSTSANKDVRHRLVGSSSSITDDNSFSSAVDHFIFNPIFTSREGENNYAKLSASIDNKLKQKLGLIKLASLASFVLFGSSLLSAPSLVDKVVYGILSYDSFRVSYNSYVKNYCQIICKQTGLGTGLLSKVAFVTSSMIMMNDREVNTDVLLHKTITMSGYERLQKVCSDMNISMYLNFYLFVCVFIHIYIYVYVYMYVCLFIYLYVRIKIYFIYTYLGIFDRCLYTNIQKIA
jgi:hypothetical protein